MSTRTVSITMGFRPSHNFQSVHFECTLQDVVAADESLSSAAKRVFRECSQIVSGLGAVASKKLWKEAEQSGSRPG